MELNAYTRTIYDMLTEKRKYIVPDFKRGYIWTINELTEFWKDIISNISVSENLLITKEHFFGSIVLVDKYNDNVSNVLIIDGHQRLITVTVLFAALVENFKNIGRDDLAISLQTLITDKKNYKIENENPCEYLQKSIQAYNKILVSPECDESNNLKIAYDYFYSKFSNLSIKDFIKEPNEEENYFTKVSLLEAIRDKVLKLIMICITVADENDAYTILGTLTAKVHNLTPVDFIKNEVIKKLNPRGLSMDAESKWREVKHILNSRVDRNTMETFLMHFWQSKYEYTSLEKLYTSFKTKVPQSIDSLSRFLDGLLVAAKDYIVISDPLPSDFRQQEERELYESIAALEIINASSTKILLLALFEIRRRNLITLSDFTKAVNKIENYHVISTSICGNHEPNLDRIYSKIAIAFRKTSSIKESKDILYTLTKELQILLPSFSIFKEDLSKVYFLDGKPRYKKIIQYIFRRWEDYLIETNELEMAELTLEHILPQSTENSYVGMLGNLLPLAGHLNHTAGDKSFIQKIEHYKRSQFKVVRQFIDKYQYKDFWDENDIIRRTNEIAKLLYYEIFKI